MLDSCAMSELPLPPEELQYPRTFDFVEGGKRVFDQLVGFGGLKPEDRVLDAGCGVGRVARHLTGYLTNSYEGFDVVPEAIAWCQEAITPRYPQFRFTLAELHNQRYSPDAMSSAAEFRWMYEDSSFDFVFAASLMTHLLPDAHENYVREARRVLKPGGRLLASYFLMNRESTRLQEQGAVQKPFTKRVAPGCRTRNPDNPEAALAYAEGRVRDLFAESGLVLIGLRYGDWCRPGADYHQDVLVAIKA